MKPEYKGACPNPFPKSVGTGGTERGCSWSFRSVPVGKKKTCSGPCIILDPASRISTVRTVYFAHATTPTRCCAQIDVHVHLRRCPSTSSGMVFVPVRSGCSALPQKEKGYNTISYFSNICCSSRAALNLFVLQTNEHQFMWQLTVHSVGPNAL